MHFGNGHVVYAHLTCSEFKPDITLEAAANNICTVNRQRLSYWLTDEASIIDQSLVRKFITFNFRAAKYFCLWASHYRDNLKAHASLGEGGSLPPCTRFLHPVTACPCSWAWGLPRESGWGWGVQRLREWRRAWEPMSLVSTWEGVVTHSHWGWGTFTHSALFCDFGKAGGGEQRTLRAARCGQAWAKLLPLLRSRVVSSALSSSGFYDVTHPAHDCLPGLSLLLSH